MKRRKSRSGRSLPGAAHAIEAHFVHHDEENVGTLGRLGGECEEGAAGEHLADST